MKKKLTFVAPSIGLTLIVVVLILGSNLYNLNIMVKSMQSDNAIEIAHEKVTNLENRFGNLEDILPDQDLDQFMRSTIIELNRIEDLLNKIDGLETVYGVVTGLDKSNQISLNVRLVRANVEGIYHETEENIEILLAENYTPYMAGEFTLMPIDNREFIKVIEEELKSDFQQGFTFKTINGEAVQIY